MDYNIVCDLNKLTKTGKYMASLQTCHAVVESAQAKTAVCSSKSLRSKNCSSSLRSLLQSKIILNGEG